MDERHAISLDKEPTILGIEFIGIVNKIGRMEDFSCKSGTIFSKEKGEMFSMFFRLQYSLQKDFDEELGSVDYSIVERGNYKIISIPIDSHIMVIATYKDVNHSEIINKVRDLVQNSLDNNIKATYEKTIMTI